MLLGLSIFLVVALLIAGVAVPMAFGGVLILIALLGDHNISAFMGTGHWKMNTIIILVIPLFIVAGDLMQRGKIAGPIVAIAELLLGRIKGGLSGACVLASAMFGAISGSGAATLTCIGSIMFPHLRRNRYPEGFSAALLVCASPLGLLIPPSGAQLIYAWLTQQSVLKCFLAALAAGLLLTIFLIIVNFVMLRNAKNIELTKIDGSPFVALGKSTFNAVPAILMPVVILGGIYGGVMTPTEAAGVAAIYSIPVGFWIYKGLTWKIFWETLKESSVTIGVVMVMIFMVLIVSKFLIFEDVPTIARNMIYSVSDNPVVVLLMINVVMILIGMLMDDFSGLVLSASLLTPIAVSTGMDPVHFAAVLGVNMGMGNITPPTAPLLFLGSRVTGVSVQAMMKPTLIFITFAWLPTLMLITYIPQIPMFLPNFFFE
ncbi:TRAP transporter large permease [Cohaesibacter gelatinilyticus]|uniref:TRAP transporter large permease protein n=1 Tax=Cohaesibacter gelatinilyticus TaxID=372072 RepID=A0A285PIH7_9HYPH|nr:TRAP transporter large permease [Cohaesibacter gelatinilyticus]SNZ21524.1 TRAP transporter, DctM subunit [Cohaesibacter gelatinilyticus]HAT85747.1 TRAP transporter large permease [Hyphomicrobiales bacterium]